MLFTILHLQFFVLLVASANTTVPALTGPFSVGTTGIEVVDYSRQDPFASTPQPRSIAVTLFYPTDAVASNATSYVKKQECKPALQASSQFAAYLEAAEGFSNGSFHNLLMRACLDAPLTQPEQPLLLFTPGLGGPSAFYSDTLEEIASYGWNIAALDHTYETAVIEFPDGRFVFALPQNGTEAETVNNVNIRTADLSSVLDALSNSTITEKIPGVTRGTKFRTQKAGVFGHSLGGATALQVLASDARFAVGANFDGSFWGEEQQIGADKPFLILAAPGHNRTSDPSWAATWSNLRSFKREYVVAGAQHLTFTDLPLFRQLGRDLPPSAEQFGGTVNGTRALGIQRAYMNSLFGRFLKGHNDGLLDGVGAQEWPEVTKGE
ncbi:hypothetical protein M426DRAFT_325482 [Hypoxylon sp. CI-4A]|nr:hypothetical protein M426DRAFT_325482 [Hypoxylon sp. CI-4A]